MIIRTIKETPCPSCKEVLDWDAVGDITNRSITITCWCCNCGKHVDLIIKRTEK